MNSILFLLLACATQPIETRGESIGSCSYTSRFSGEPECRDFFDGEVAVAEASCAKESATFAPGVACDVADALGTCTYEDDAIQIRATVEGTSSDTCGSNRFGCETFAGGFWDPSPACDGAEEIVVLQNPFPLPERVCVDPIEGEPPGQSEDGQVCTWQMVSGATEEGRAYSDYAECDTIRRMRPYSPVPPNARAAEPDARMDDPTYVAEVDWVKGQLRSGSCDCCHSAKAPDGPSVFDVDFEGNIANQFNDRGLAMGAGWIPTIGFGTYEPEDNNGFERSSPENPNISIIPTTDQVRMMAFFEGELALRGRTRDEFANDVYGAGPLDEQLNYEPEACSEAEGVGSDGLLRWLPGRARYVYVLEVDAFAPTVPPNLDLPDGTLWRLDLPLDGDPVASETIVYGEVPATMAQVFPAEGAPVALETGKQYYLYVLADVLYPISRCVFTAGVDAPKTGCNSTGGAVGAITLIGALAGLGRRRRPEA